MELTPFFFGLYKFVKYGLYPLTWVVLLWGLTTCLLLLPAHTTRLRWARIGAVTSLLLLLFISNPILSNFLIGTLETWHPKPPAPGTGRYDAIVVLGGGVLDRGTLRPTVELSSYSRDRTTCGVNFYQQGYAKKLLLTGGDSSIFGSGPKEAEEMKRWAERLGVPEQAIVIEDGAKTTYENAVGTRQLLGKASILLVSSASHLPRATALFAKQGFIVTPTPCDYATKNRPSDLIDRMNLFDMLPSDLAIQRTRDAINEMAGIAVYWMTGKL
jgi:uncharacterized SAM-binding protein YcdF (DUF218 family)